MDRFDRIAARGVDAVIPLLEVMSFDGRVMPITGTNIEKDLQLIGTDLVLWTSNDCLQCIEVKASEQANEKFFIETVTDIITARQGWLPTLKVDLLAHISLANNRAILFRWPEFKIWFDENVKDYRRTAVFQVDNKKTAVGLWIPWKDIAHGIGRDNFGTYDLTNPDQWPSKLRDMGLK